MCAARFILVAMLASEAPQYSRARLLGPGCCRTMGGGLTTWSEPSTAGAIAAKRVHDFPMNHTACAVQCAALKGCTHFELNMYDQPAGSNRGVCSVFASGGYSVTTGCKDNGERPRMHCFAAANLAGTRATLTQMVSFSSEALLLPIAWVHVPKAGSTFINTLIHSVCSPPLTPFAPVGSTTGPVEHEFWERAMSLAQCNFTSSPHHAGYGSPPGHRGYGTFASLPMHAGHGVLLMRQPEQRIISGFHHNFHSFEEKKTTRPSLLAYARAVEGCVVRMLTRGSLPEHSDAGEAACGRAPPPSSVEVERAKELLSTGFQFVGLTEEWDITVCLWHVRFGPASCSKTEFLNMRPGTGRKIDASNRTLGLWSASRLAYDTAPLASFKDRFDGPIYEEVQRLFWKDVGRAGVTRAACAAWKERCDQEPHETTRRRGRAVAARSGAPAGKATDCSACARKQLRGCHAHGPCTAFDDCSFVECRKARQWSSYEPGDVGYLYRLDESAYLLAHWVSFEVGIGPQIQLYVGSNELGRPEWQHDGFGAVGRQVDARVRASTKLDRFSPPLTEGFGHMHFYDDWYHRNIVHWAWPDALSRDEQVHVAISTLSQLLLVPCFAVKQPALVNLTRHVHRRIAQLHPQLHTLNATRTCAILGMLRERSLFHVECAVNKSRIGAPLHEQCLLSHSSQHQHTAQ